jgi:aspartyl/asparaginyl beta-hydroxylase (cupin superfamily)
MNILVKQFPEIDMFMFSILEPTSTIPVHRGFQRGVTRFMLPLIVPGYDYNGTKLHDAIQHGLHIASTLNESSQQCKLIIGENLYSHFGRYRGSKMTPISKTHSEYYTYDTYEYHFQPGVSLLWDDTYAHSVANLMDTPRIVILADIRRPPPPGSWISVGCLFSSLINWLGIGKYLYLNNQQQEKRIPHK